MKVYRCPFLALMLTGMLVAGCGKKDLTPVTGEHDELLELAYATGNPFPDGFYQEEDPASSTYYVNTVSIKPQQEREHEWVELHTDSEEQASAWVKSTRANSSGHTVPQGASQTPKYFEYPAAMESGHIIRYRAHKSSYFEPVLDKFHPDKTIGRYNGAMDGSAVAEFIQYLWVNYNMSMGGQQSGSKVLEAEGSVDNGVYTYRIRSLSISYGDWGLHDMIYVHDYYFSLATATRMLTHEKTVKIAEIRGHYQSSHLNK